jgi:cobalamin biosynthesis Mg chelatase CobN
LTATRRIAIVVALVGVGVLTLGIGSATAATTCAKKVIADWYKDGRVDGTYPLHCYEEAIDALPEDVVQYSSAKDDIERALQDALREGAPPGQPEPSTPEEEQPEEEEEPTDTSGVPPTDPDEPTTGPTAGDDKEQGEPESLAPTESTSSDASSVPLPLIVLGALALLLLAAGGAGYLNRRLQARRVDGGVADPPADV